MFRYYITNTYDGCIYGTNDDKKAEDCSASEDYYVVDTKTGEWMNVDGRQPVMEIK